MYEEVILITDKKMDCKSYFLKGTSRYPFRVCVTSINNKHNLNNSFLGQAFLDTQVRNYYSLLINKQCFMKV